MTNDNYFSMQKKWSDEISNHLGRMKRGNVPISCLLSEEEMELIRKRDEELEHARDIREHYERKLEKANNLYMEVTALLLQLEQREGDLIEREQNMCACKTTSRRLVTPVLESAFK